MVGCTLAQKEIRSRFQAEEEAVSPLYPSSLMRSRWISKSCELGHSRETQAVDLLLSRLEISFLFQLLYEADASPDLFSFYVYEKEFEASFLQNCSEYIGIQLEKSLGFVKGCKSPLPANQRV